MCPSDRHICLFRIAANCQRLWPQLHLADSHRIRGLQTDGAPQPAAALTTVAHSNIETAHDGPPHNLFLILGLGAFPFHAAATMRAAIGQ